jgi:hypothetical protein
MDTPTQENQHEFFPDFVKPSERKAEPRLGGIGTGRTQKPILFTTTIEQILFAAIVAILVLCGVYFLGILRGKSLAASVSAAPVRALRIPRPATPAPPIVTVQATSAAKPAPTRPAVPAPPVSSRVQRLASPAPVAAGTPAAAQPAAGTVRRLYTIQVVTHKKRAFAEGELAAVGQAGFSGRILESDDYFVVCVGQYASKEEAKKDLTFLKAKYPDCFLRRL